MTSYQTVIVSHMFVSLDLGITYCDLALNTSKEEARARNTMNAMNAQARAVDLFDKAVLNPSEKQLFTEDMDRIDHKLDALRLLRS